MNKKLSKKLSALGLAKLPGFFEWLCIHPIMVEVDGDESRQESSSSHKMIIFAYHHKVLDGVQVRRVTAFVSIPLLLNILSRVGINVFDQSTRTSHNAKDINLHF